MPLLLQTNYNPLPRYTPIPTKSTTFLSIHWGTEFAFKPAQTRTLAPVLLLSPRYPESKASGKICSVNDLPWTRMSFSPCTDKIKNCLLWSLQKKPKSWVCWDTYSPTLLTMMPPLCDGVEALAAALTRLFLFVSLGFGRFPRGITLKLKVQVCD